MYCLTEYVCCVCDASVSLSVPSLCQICMRDLISEFNTEIEVSIKGVLCSDVSSVLHCMSYVFWD